MNEEFLNHLRERIHYDPNTGYFIWKKNKYRSRIGKRTGAIKDGYVQILIAGKLYRAHRLAWLLMTGEWPSHQIDHINLDRSDNRWANLRAADKRQNAMNTRVRRDNKSGYKGVCWDQGCNKWRADIRLPSVRKHLGLFDDPEAAHAAYARAATRYFGEYGRVS